MLFGSRLNKLATSIRRALSEYAVLGINPPFVADFIEKKYLTGGASSTFSSAINHSRTTNATMTDGYGPELVTNGGFDTDAGWYLNGFTIANGVLSKVSGTGNSKTALFPATIENGKTYEIAFNYTDTGANLKVGFATTTTSSSLGAGAITVPEGTGRKAIYLTATADGASFGFHGHDAYKGIVDNVSVREMPVIKWAPHNLLTYSEEFDNGAWTKASGVTIQANQTVAPDGTQTADNVTYSSGGAGEFLRQSIGGLLTGQAGTFAVWVKSISGNTIFALDQGNGVSSGALTATSDWQLFQVSFIKNSNNWLDIQLGSGGGGVISVWGAHLYRSDLGGMVDNPERGDSYVPTALRLTGPQLVTNGTFNSDVSGWSSQTGSIEVADNALQITSDDGWVYQEITVESGKRYSLEATPVSNGNQCLFYVGNGIGQNQLVSLSSPTETISKTFVPTTSSIYISIKTLGSAAKWDNISTRETLVDPSAARYLPRVGHHVYNGSAWVNEGVLAESEQRVNQLTYSNSLNQWDAFAVGITTTTATASPDGQTGAYKAVPTTASGSHFFEINDSYPYIKTTTTGTTFTFSIYAKAAEYNVLQLASSSGFAARYQNFDLTNGVKLSGDVVGATIEDVGNGWYRCSVTEITTSSTNGARFLSISANSDITRNQSFAGDGTSGIYVWGAQAEEGHATPSSFIPSDDGTSAVTRAAETFTIPSANLPWPTPQYIGSDLVDNGDFATTSDWSLQSGVSIGGGVLSSDGTSTGELARQSNIGVTSGNLYAISLDVISLTAGKFGVKLGGTTPFYFNTTGSHEAYIVATATDNVQIMGLSGTTGSVDNVSVREINPLSVSIAMDGAVTYADTNTAPEVGYWQWLEDNSNNLVTYIDCGSSRTGQIIFKSEENAVTDKVSTSTTYFSPDILVPYNIASRHGSTFVNGAESGVALTADTTPTALPDLSSTDLELANDYMGTISSFRVWDKDITDDGLVEATNPSLEPSLSLTFEGTGTNSFVVNDWAE